MSNTNEARDDSPTLPSHLSTELSSRSPAINSTFSQATTLHDTLRDTVQTSNSNYTTNTGGRARQSWRNSLNSFLRPTSFLSNDPATVPSTLDKRERAQAEGRSDVDKTESAKFDSNYMGKTALAPAIELPASPVAASGEATSFLLPASPMTGPNEPPSFFESDSESDGEPVVRRAASVRTQRPQLVQHNSGPSGRVLRVYGQRPNPFDKRPGPSLGKAEQLLGIGLSDLRPATEPLIKESRESPTKDLPKPSNTINPGSTSKSEQSELLQPMGGRAEALEALTANVLDAASTTALAPTPSSSAFASTPTAPAAIIEQPNTPTRVSALGTLPSPLFGFGRISVPNRHLPNGVSQLATNGLTSHPLTQADISAIQLQRALSAPPRPLRHSQHPHRKVTIRPLDVEAAGHYNPNHMQQAVVSTPYPTHITTTIRNDNIDITDVVSPLSAIASGTKLTSALPAPVTTESRLQSDRFPSPTHPEILHLSLISAGHPSSTHTALTIPVPDKRTFDDEALFTYLRRTYTQDLLGPTRHFLTARVLADASTTTNTMAGSRFDAGDFIRHLYRPRLGRKRKTWLIWLREEQSPVTLKGSEKSNSVSFSGFSYSHSHANSNSNSPASATTPTTTRMPFSPRTRRQQPPCITLHHSFSLLRVAAAVLVTVLLSVLAAVLWVLFGVPGGDTGIGEGWAVDAQARVLTGLVLGLFVAMLGTLLGTGWVWGSWVML